MLEGRDIGLENNREGRQGGTAGSGRVEKGGRVEAGGKGPIEGGLVDVEVGALAKE